MGPLEVSAAGLGYWLVDEKDTDPPLDGPSSIERILGTYACELECESYLLQVHVDGVQPLQVFAVPRASAAGSRIIATSLGKTGG